MILGTIVIDLDPNLFQVGPFLITWHGVFSVLGILAAARVAQILLGRVGIRAERVYDLAVWMVVAGLIGARLLYVWENYQQFTGAWIKVLAVNEGGISQWGGIFGGLVGAYIWCWRNKVDLRQVLDAAGVVCALGFAIGRIGDVINGEHHAIASSLPWAVSYINPRTLGELGKPVHPEVAYELIFNVVVFTCAILSYSWFKRRLPAGVTGLIWLSVFATGRFFLSFLRTDSLVLGLRQAQWASVVMVVVSVVLIAVWMQWTRRQPSAPQPIPTSTETGSQPGTEGAA